MTRMPDPTARRRPPDVADDPDAMMPNEIECLKARTLDRLYHCMARFTGQIARDWLYCGKAACVRARRCRGSACEPDGDDT